MAKYFLALHLLAVIVFINSSENDDKNKAHEFCFQTVNKAQEELKHLVIQLKNIPETAKLPLIKDDAIEKIEKLKNFTKEIKKLNKEEVAIVEKAELLYIDKVIEENDLNSNKIEKEINKLQSDINYQNISALENITEVIKNNDASLDSISKFHNEVSKICKASENKYKIFEKDIDNINVTFTELAHNYENVWKEHELVQEDIFQIEEMTNNIKIPESYVAEYLCGREGKLQKNIDENIKMLDENKDILDGIIKDFKMDEVQNAKNLETVIKLIDELNQDVVIVNDALKLYENEIPDKAVIDVVSTEEVNDLENDVNILETLLSKLSLNVDTSHAEMAIQEFERKFDVLTFIASEQNLQKVSDEIETLEGHLKRMYKLDIEKRLLEAEEKQIKSEIDAFMGQTLCQKAKNEE